MQTSANNVEQACILRDSAKHHSRTLQPLSDSPRSAQMSELLNVRTEHSFTRRIYSFNRDRNPDLVHTTPSHRRQTCSSLIKRNSSHGGSSNVSSGSRRTTSMGEASLNHSGGDEKRVFRRAQSTLGKARGRTSEFKLNDELGFFVDQMPDDGVQIPVECEWLQGNTMDEWLVTQQRTRRSATRQSRQQQTVSKKGGGVTRRNKKGGKRNEFSAQVAKGPSRTGGSARGGIQSRVKPRDLKHQHQFYSTGPSDRKSDSANNMSSGKLDDADLNVAAPTRAVKSVRPRSAAPSKQTGVTRDKERRPSSKAQDPKRNASRNSVKSKTKDSDTVNRGLQSRPKNPNQKPRNNNATQQKTESTAKNENQPSNDEFRTTANTEEAPRVDAKCEIMEEEIAVAEEKEHQIEERGEMTEGEAKEMDSGTPAPPESSSQTKELDTGCSPITQEVVKGQSEDDRQSSTTCTADDVSAAAPIGLEDNPFMHRSDSEHSVAEYCDAFSKSCVSSKDSGSEAQADGQYADESLRNRKKSFKKDNTFHRRSESSGNSDSRSVDQSRVEEPSSQRKTLVARLKCCRIPLKSCFCGVDVSWGHQNDDDLRHSVVRYD